MSRLPREKVVTPEVPITVWEDPGGKRQLDRDALCSLLITADHAYIAARFLIWADTRILALAFFLAAQAVETYLKAFLVSRLGTLPPKLTSGKKGHNLVLLAQHATAAPDSDPLFGERACREILKRLTPMNQAGRYPRSGYRGPAGELGGFVDWLDNFARRVRQLVPYPEKCRDDIQLLREFDPASTPIDYEALGRGALRDLFFAQNRAFDGWFLTKSGRRVKMDNSPW